jgi:excisionase family DNA binding protein
VQVCSGTRTASDAPCARTVATDLLNDHAYLTPAQVAEMLQVSPKTITRWALQDASMPCVRLPGTVVRFEEGALLRWLERKRQGRTVRRAGDPNSTASS